MVDLKLGQPMLLYMHVCIGKIVTITPIKKVKVKGDNLCIIGLHPLLYRVGGEDLSKTYPETLLHSTAPGIR